MVYSYRTTLDYNIYSNSSVLFRHKYNETTGIISVASLTEDENCIYFYKISFIIERNLALADSLSPHLQIPGCGAELKVLAKFSSSQKSNEKNRLFPKLRTNILMSSKIRTK